MACLHHKELFQRVLSQYMQILRNNGFIYYAGKDRTPR